MPIFDQSAYEDMKSEQAITLDAPNTDDRGKWTSASAAEYDALCPARHLRSLAVPEQPSGQDAQRGNRIHAALAGETVNPPLNGEEYECFEQLKRMEFDVIKQWSGGQETVCCRERRLWMFVGDVQHSGKPDAIYFDNATNRALIIDYKTGRGDVTKSPSNLQLRDLAVLVARNNSSYDVTVCILQPFTTPLLCRYDADFLLAALSNLESRVQASNDPTARAFPGEKQCKWCRAKATCPEFLTSCEPPVDAACCEPAEEQIRVSIASLDGPRLGTFLSMVRLASDTAEEEVRLRLGKGQTVDGWKLGKPTTRETITDPNTVHERFVNRGGSTTLFLECITVAKGKLKTALKAATGLKGKPLDEGMADLVAGCVEEKEISPKLEQE